MRRHLLLSMLFVASAFAGLGTAVALESGPPASTKDKLSFLPGSFQILGVTPEQSAGRFHDPISDFGLNPAVLIFTRAEPDQLTKGHDLSKLIKQLDEVVGKYPEVQLGGCVVFMNDGGYRDAVQDNSKKDELPKAIEFKDRRQQQIKDFAKNIGLEHVALGIGTVASPEKYNINPNAELTVLVCNRLQVAANFAYGKDEKPDATAIMDSINKMLPAKK